MPIEVLMPALSPTMTEGGLAKWHVKAGDRVASGDVLAEIETDKATMEVEAVDEGIVAALLVAEGSEAVAVNRAIALLAEEGEDPAQIAASASSTASAPAPISTPAPAAPVVTAPQTAPAQTAPAQDENAPRLFASPLARRLAAEAGLDLATLTGSGPHGRIIRADVDAALRDGPPAAVTAAPAPAVAPVSAPAPTVDADALPLALLPPYEAVANSTMRKVIARRLTESARDIPHFNLSMELELDPLLAVRKRLNDRAGDTTRISVNDFVIKGVALALARRPDCNVAWTEAAILRFARADIAIAVAVEGGLITPIIHDAGAMGLAAISKTARTLAEKARAGKLAPEEFQGGTFTISNLGMFGVASFNSIINPPQAGILSVGAGTPRPVVRDGALATATVMSLTLAVDHRCIDGATAASFMAELKSILEEPLQLML